MKSLWIVIFGAIGIAIAYVFTKGTGKAASSAGAGTGGCLPPNFVGPLTPQQTALPKCGDSSAFQVNQIAQNGGNLWNVDQKVMNTQPDSSYFSSGPSKPVTPAVSPLNIFDPPPPAPPLEIIGTPGGVAGTASGITYPTSVPPPPGNDGSPASDLSPTFWAADTVPLNPYLQNGLTGPTYTA